jgi:hypothetical protein
MAQGFEIGCMSLPTYSGGDEPVKGNHHPRGRLRPSTSAASARAHDRRRRELPGRFELVAERFHKRDR